MKYIKRFFIVLAVAALLLVLLAVALLAGLGDDSPIDPIGPIGPIGSSLTGTDWRTTGIARDGGTITRDGEDTYVLVCVNKADAVFYYDTEDQMPFDGVGYPVSFGGEVWDQYRGIDFADLNGDGNSDVTMRFDDGSEIKLVWYWVPGEGYVYQPEESSTGDRRTVDEIYHELLDRFYALVSDPGSDMSAAGDGEYGVMEAALGLGDDALNGIGYLIKDMTDDGVPELVVGSLREYGGEVFALYTLVDRDSELVFEGWSRNSYTYVNTYVGGSSVFYNSGSNSATESCQGVFILSRNGREMNWRWFYFTVAEDGNPDKVTLYVNNTGSWDPAESEVAYETLDEYYDLFSLPVEERVLSSFWALNNCTESGLDLTPFSDWS